MKHLSQLAVCLLVISLFVTISCGDERTPQERQEAELMKNCEDMVEDCFDRITDGKLNEASVYTLSGSVPPEYESLDGYDLVGVVAELQSDGSALVEVTINLGDSEVEQEYRCVMREDEWKLILE